MPTYSRRSHEKGHTIDDFISSHLPILPDSDKLEKHQEKAHNKKKEKCRVCGTEFDTTDDLRKHKKNCK